MIISKTPLRISFFGGGTDFPEFFNRTESFVLGSTINKFIYLSFQKKNNIDKDRIKIFYKNNEFVNNVNKIQHRVIRSILKKEKINTNFEMHICSDMPSFSGLGTSSAFTVGLKNLINYYKNIKTDPYKLANFSINFERNILKETVGFQDQIHASYGGLNIIKFFPKNKFKVKKIEDKKKINKISNNLFLVFTNITRRASNIEKKKISKIEKNFKILNTINNIAKQSLLIFNKDLNEDLFGELLAENWELKKKLDLNVSNPTIDKIYEKGIASGATGGKLLGAGAGGFLLFYVKKKYHRNFLKKLNDKKIIDFNLHNEGSKVFEI
tara:strand:- start:666 stop:1640 length:975 start_codon:yes stop_codon:yes gene_type:complete